MANHKSSEKRIRQTATKRAHNRLYHKTARNAVKALRSTTDKSAAEALLPKVTAMLDKLAKTNIIHKNKAANLKGAIQLHVNALYRKIEGLGIANSRLRKSVACFFCFIPGLLRTLRSLKSLKSLGKSSTPQTNIPDGFAVGDVCLLNLI